MTYQQKVLKLSRLVYIFYVICGTDTANVPSESESGRAACILPQHPDFGKWVIFGDSSRNFVPGTKVNTGSILQMSCYEPYKLQGNSILLCDNGKWLASGGKCLKTCPPIYSSSSTKVTCFVNGEKTENCTDAVDGTQVRHECAPFYEDLQLSRNPVHICKNGKWDYPSPKCVPVCGQKPVSAQIFIINGTPVKRTDYPWHVAIYRGSDKRYICSGAIISPRIILTAAQCVTEPNGRVEPKNLYTIAAGKYYRKFNDSREPASEVQTSELQEIIVHPHYEGFSRTAVGNIAILIAAKPLRLSPRVQPVCVDWGLNYTSNIDNSGTNLAGVITGWGFTSKNEKPADELQEMKVLITNNQKCNQELPESFSTYLTYDKFCTGYLNKSRTICRGDSGGPLVVKFGGRFYITGLAQSTPTSASGGCDIQQHALYTNISTYADSFILPKTVKYE